MAEGVLRHHIQTKGLRIKVDSAGTNGYHNGEAPDSRAQAEMRRHGIEIAAQESRQIKKKDFDRFDLILVMDTSNHHDVLALAGERKDWQDKVQMFLPEGMCQTLITVVTQGSQRCLTLSIVPRRSGQTDGSNPNESRLKTKLPLLCVKDAPYRIPLFSIAVGLGHTVAVELQFNVPRQ